jgi:hypothetical protein
MGKLTLGGETGEIRVSLTTLSFQYQNKEYHTRGWQERQWH